jgi:hypothetical protein
MGFLFFHLFQKTNEKKRKNLEEKKGTISVFFSFSFLKIKREEKKSIVVEPEKKREFVPIVQLCARTRKTLFSFFFLFFFLF